MMLENDFESAIPLFEEYIEKYPKHGRIKKAKKMVSFCKEQLPHQNYKKASAYYQKVIKANPEYEMVFDCKINKAQCVQGHSKQSEKVRSELLKMTKDDKGPCAPGQNPRPRGRRSRAPVCQNVGAVL